MTENNAAEMPGETEKERAGVDQLADVESNSDDRDAVVGDQVRWFVPIDGGKPLCALTAEGRAHDRHVTGPMDAPIHCPGLAREAADDLGTYRDALAAWEAENAWSKRYGPLVHHARVLAGKLDRDPDAPASLSSAYLQAISRLERMRPASEGGNPGDGLTPPGAQASIFDHLED